VTAGVVSLMGGTALSDAPERTRIVEQLPASRGGLYVGNREPLAPSPLAKLPIGSITPRGWLRHQLELEAAGMVGRLPKLSHWIRFEESPWARPDGLSDRGWEEMPYWLRGYGDLGYVLQNEEIMATTRKWIDAILAGQEESGWFGPQSLKTSLKGQPDLWPHMLVLNTLQSFYEFSGDERVIPFMLDYHRWLSGQPPETFRAGYWPHIRWGDNLETIYWLYNRTGEAWLLPLAQKIHVNMARWSDDVINWHNVNIAQGFRTPGEFYLQTGDAKLLDQAERNYQKVMRLYGQFPGGGFAGDENCRPGFGDPRQAFETCGIVEFMHSFEMLTKISGSPIWADRCEELAFNTLPAAITPDWKGLHYLTSANMVQLDRRNKSPSVQNGGTMFSYSPFEVYRCCQHNVSHGWPYYAEELWLATADNGLCASLYAACDVRAKVGDGTELSIAERTDYPFGDMIELVITTPGPVNFPLYLRIPRWCDAPEVEINGQRAALETGPLSYAVIEREWNSGDTVTLRLPMRVTVRRWEKNHNAVSVDRGPLTYSLKIGERWERYGDRHPDWPEWEVHPTTAWNFGLELDERDPAASFEVTASTGPVAENPFTPETAPIEMTAQARKIAAWQQDSLGVVGKLQPSPAKSDAPLETVTLIPMGAARLRITAFPVIGHGPDAHEWTVPALPPVTASHCYANDTVEAMIDGRLPQKSSDHGIPRFTWWDHVGTQEWVEWKFARPRKVSAVGVYWFDDTGIGRCRAPESWTLSYRAGERWVPVEGASEFGVALDQFNRVTFNVVETDGLRIDVQLRREVSGGILEWRVEL
jgi:hypothetical protein